MIRTATLTFHASHNYGSMLQAYALQSVLTKSIGVENEIINLRTSVQKSIYPNPTKIPHSLRGWISFACRLPMMRELSRKFHLFEDFLEKELALSKEFHSMEEVADYAKNFDCLITGSDQIWNTAGGDFDGSYYLPSCGCKRIAYAPSMGPHANEQVSPKLYGKIDECLNEFDAVSVRERGTADVISSITGNRPEVFVDPTVLIAKTEWEHLASDKNPVKGKYIFLYHPSPTNDICNLAAKISKQTGIPVVSSNKIPLVSMARFTLFKPSRIKQSLSAGPKEFLRLIMDSELVISGSFHAVVFSILFHKPFLAYNGLTDNRMSQILYSTGLEDYAVTDANYLSKLPLLNEIDFSQADEYIAKERKRSLDFLKKNIVL